ncbi:MAG: fasciclin domain-containing protein [Pseudonocardia sp.]|nr:fasciclin domain-containing protein [Pseudonocardia sp.]
MRIRRVVTALSVAVAATGLAACGAGQAPVSSSFKPAASTSAAASTVALPGGEFGPACSKVPSTGAGSFTGMAEDPVATAASHNPALSTLVSAVKKANLVDTLNSAENITVFAPANTAFDKIPPATLKKTLAGKAMLTKILTYHVVDQRISPEDLASGEFTTLEGARLKTSGSGENFTINGTSHVICGNVRTANATVYIIDTLLMPPADTDN